MKYLKIMGLCLVAVFLVNAVAVATASAAEEPELRRTGGSELAKKKFKEAATSGKYVLETKGLGAIECTSSAVEGEVRSPTESEATVTLTGCSASGEKCNSEETGSKEGRVRAVVSIRPRWSRGSRRFVLFLKTILPRTRQIVVLCSALQTIKINGGFLAEAGEIEKSHTELTLSAKQKGGVQELTEFETEAKVIETTTLETEGSGLKKFAKTQSAAEAALTITFEEAVEFRA
ncbi:MAG TPA: hypothetical protein VNV42_12750 [Solirubrobacteraceae bacterium]|nr:hypothetical protein [Solirubrobacteraceae bacterium]